MSAAGLAEKVYALLEEAGHAVSMRRCAAIIALVTEANAARFKAVALDPRNIDFVGGSTGNAFGTARRIADAIDREAARRLETGGE